MTDARPTGAPTPVVQRIIELMYEKRLSGRKLSEMIGRSSSYMSTLTGGKVEYPDPGTLKALSDVLGEDLLLLVPRRGGNHTTLPTPARSLQAPSPGPQTGLPLAGIVETGSWREPEILAAVPPMAVGLMRDPRHADAGQRAFLVRGTGMNEALMFEGDLVRAVDYTDPGLGVTPRMIVVADHRQASGLVERSLREVTYVGGEIHLIGRDSTRAIEPIVVPMLTNLADPEAPVRVVGFVTAVYREIPI